MPIANRRYLYFALYTAAAFLWEVVIISAEHALYGIPSADWALWQMLLHWGLTCCAWGLSGWLLCRAAAKRLDFQPFGRKERLSGQQLLVLLVLIALFTLYMSASWEWQFKPYAEWRGKNALYGLGGGSLAFLFQYLYYLFEALLIYILISFAQEFGERVWHNRRIPYGGIILGLTWGLGHIFTKDFGVGILSLLGGIVFGAGYLVARGNSRIAYLAIALMFML